MGTSINSLWSLCDLKHAAARHEPQRNGYSIVKVRNAADACFRSHPTGLCSLLRLCVILAHHAMSMLSQASLDSEQGTKPEAASY
ncbi:MAG: hypothetical protein COA83_00115 [Methylophaga sp.]|nr:MAG: hypothetical protein COA83_00115 [Methylophaga sp.]